MSFVRVPLREAVEETGVPLRTLQDMAARGDLPGAVKIGSRWKIDLARLRRWINQRESDQCPIISTSEATSGGAECRFEDATCDEAYERLIGGKPRRGSRR
jgi:excisionase family DNA binding protein